MSIYKYYTDKTSINLLEIHERYKEHIKYALLLKTGCNIIVSREMTAFRDACITYELECTGIALLIDYRDTRDNEYYVKISAFKTGTDLHSAYSIYSHDRSYLFEIFKQYFDIILQDYF